MHGHWVYAFYQRNDPRLFDALLSAPGSAHAPPDPHGPNSTLVSHRVSTTNHTNTHCETHCIPPSFLLPQPHLNQLLPSLIFLVPRATVPPTPREGLVAHTHTHTNSLLTDCKQNLITHAQADVVCRCKNDTHTHTHIPSPPTSPFKTWYQNHYGVEVGKKKGKAKAAASAEEEVKKSESVKKKLKARQATRVLDPKVSF